MIIFVGYRVNSKKATSFRRCATKILRNYMINGYTVNQIRDMLYSESNSRYFTCPINMLTSVVGS